MPCQAIVQPAGLLRRLPLHLERHTAELCVCNVPLAVLLQPSTAACCTRQTLLLQLPACAPHPAAHPHRNHEAGACKQQKHIWGFHRHFKPEETHFKLKKPNSPYVHHCSEGVCCYMLLPTRSRSVVICCSCC